MTRRLASQRAVVQALRCRVNAAITARDDAAGEDAHDALIAAELRMHRMEGFAVTDPDDDVFGRGA